MNKETRQRISGLILLIPMSDKRFLNSNPRDFNYKKWKELKEAYRKEFRELVGEEYDIKKKEEYELRILKRYGK